MQWQVGLPKGSTNGRSGMLNYSPLQRDILLIIVDFLTEPLALRSTNHFKSFVIQNKPSKLLLCYMLLLGIEHSVTFLYNSIFFPCHFYPEQCLSFDLRYRLNNRNKLANCGY